MSFEAPNQEIPQERLSEESGPNPERRRLKDMEMGELLEGAKNKFRAAGFALATVAATVAASENLSTDENSGNVSPHDKLENTQTYGEPYFERSDAFDNEPSMDRAETLAERMGLSTDNLEVHFSGYVPTEINGESVMHLLTDAEIAEVESAQKLSKLMDEATEGINIGDEENDNSVNSSSETSEEGEVFQSKPIDQNAF